MKRCTHCKNVKPVSAFYADKTKKDGLGLHCKECMNARHKGFMLRNRRHIAAWQRRRTYAAKFGLSAAGLSRLIELAEGKCQICRKPLVCFGQSSDSMVLDHDHTTGDIRGILCAKCNKALGLLGDSLEGLERAVTYLRDAEDGRVLMELRYAAQNECGEPRSETVE
jgi:hypothetical protein